jgi:hypothetical protein
MVSMPALATNELWTHVHDRAMYGPVHAYPTATAHANDNDSLQSSAH